MKTKIQTQIIKKTGISQSTVSNIMTGRRRPSWRMAKRLADATQTDPVLWMEGSCDEIKTAISEIQRSN